MPKYRVTKLDNGLTLGEFLARKIPAAPSGYLRQLVKTGKVSSALGPISFDSIVMHNDCIDLPESKRLLSFIAEASRGVDILYESREILIADKPAGLAVHRSKGHEQDNLTARVERSSTGQFKIAPVHRLDLETSGPILFGKGRKSCSELGQLMMAGGMRKVYIALVKGQLSGEGVFDSEIPAKGKVKAALTGYRVIRANGIASLLEIELLTGRQHQIRRQLADAGHPLYGDQRYRGPCLKQLPRLFLHCCQLTFNDPFSNGQVDIQSPLPELLQTCLRHVGLCAAEVNSEKGDV
jgi:RluA family pseudouridine synthase